MAYTFNDMTFLTAAQRNAAQQLAEVGAQSIGPGGGRLPPGVTPPLSLSNTKRAAEILRDLDGLWRDVRTGIAASINYYRAQAIADQDAANP